MVADMYLQPVIGEYISAFIPHHSSFTIIYAPKVRPQGLKNHPLLARISVITSAGQVSAV